MIIDIVPLGDKEWIRAIDTEKMILYKRHKRGVHPGERFHVENLTGVWKRHVQYTLDVNN